MRRRRGLLLLAACGLAVGLLACSPSRNNHDPARHDQPQAPRANADGPAPKDVAMSDQTPDRDPALPAAFRRFVVRTYEAELGGYRFIEVRADGVVRHLAADLVPREEGGEQVMTPMWRLAEAPVPASKLAAFAALLDSSGYRDLEPRYVDPSVHDGLVEDVFLEEESGVTHVHVENRQPRAIEVLMELIRRELVPETQAALTQAPWLTHDQAQPLWEAVVPPSHRGR